MINSCRATLRARNLAAQSLVGDGIPLFLAKCHHSNPPPNKDDPPFGLPKWALDLTMAPGSAWAEALVPEKKFILYRFAVCAPWPPSAIPSEWKFAHALALVFHACPVTISGGTRLADQLIPWSQAFLQHILTSRQISFQSLYRS